MTESNAEKSKKALADLSDAIQRLVEATYRAGCDDTIQALKNAAKKEEK